MISFRDRYSSAYARLLLFVPLTFNEICLATEQCEFFSMTENYQSK